MLFKECLFSLLFQKHQPAAVAQLDVCRTGGKVARLISAWSRNLFSLRLPNQPKRENDLTKYFIGYEIFCKVILSLRLIQQGQLSFSAERMCTSTG